MSYITTQYQFSANLQESAKILRAMVEGHVEGCQELQRTLNDKGAKKENIAASLEKWENIAAMNDCDLVKATLQADHWEVVIEGENIIGLTYFANSWPFTTILDEIAPCIESGSFIEIFDRKTKITITYDWEDGDVAIYSESGGEEL